MPGLLRVVQQRLGHANIGMAHGIAGPLTLLSLAAKRGIAVDGHLEAIETICTWLDSWRQDGPHGPWWPYWVSRSQLCGDEPVSGPGRPSWCYGTAGLARAQQLAAIATGNTKRQEQAEHALAVALNSVDALAGITDASLCHGYAGLIQVARRAHRDAITGDLNGLTDRLITAICAHGEVGTAEHLITAGGIGLLEGATGTALALHTTCTSDLPEPGWDACLLIN